MHQFMKILFRSYIKKYIAYYHDKPVAVGNTFEECIIEAIRPSLFTR